MSGTSKNIHGNKTTQTHEKKKHNKNKQTNKTQQQKTTLTFSVANCLIH